MTFVLDGFSWCFKVSKKILELMVVTISYKTVREICGNCSEIVNHGTFHTFSEQVRHWLRLVCRSFSHHEYLFSHFWTNESTNSHHLHLLLSDRIQHTVHDGFLLLTNFLSSEINLMTAHALRNFLLKFSY